MTTSWPSLPSWQQSELEQLGASGQLSGVNPLVLGVIDVEESAGQGGGINPQNYGGFFGLGRDKTYPGGTATGAMLSDPSQASFAQQAQIAASAFASYLGVAGGDPIKAEEIYQSGAASGPTAGSNLLQQYLGGASATSGASGAQGATGTTASLLDPSTWFSGATKDFTNWATKAMFIVLGLGLGALGVWKLANPGKSASSSVSQTAKKLGSDDEQMGAGAGIGGKSSGGGGGSGAAAAAPELAAA
jgi:hypothetical protein